MASGLQDIIAEVTTTLAPMEKTFSDKYNDTPENPGVTQGPELKGELPK